jgi:beta-lactamase class D
VSCRKSGTSEHLHETSVESLKIGREDFQLILDAENVSGSILIHDLRKNRYYSNNFSHADSGFIPASTFKIPNSLIALETGVIPDDSTLIAWDGTVNSVANWNQDMIFRDAFHFSCVPCYREIARNIGVQRMRSYIEKFDYGHMDVQPENLDIFWLQGNSRISQFEQIDFLKRFYKSELPISEQTETIAKRMMTVEGNKNYRLMAKTGRSITDIGWYVGYVDKGDEVYFFATNIQPKGEFITNTRIEVTRAALKKMSIIE